MILPEPTLREGRSKTTHGRHLIRLDRTLGKLVNIPAAVLVATEIVVLFAGVFARYVLHSPLVWSDELAGILFLWLAMMGAASATHRNLHMRMTALVNRRPDTRRSNWDVIALTSSLLFLALIFVPCLDYVGQQGDISSAALNVNDSWRVGSMLFAITVMIAITTVKLALIGIRHALVGLGVAVTAFVTISVCGPVLQPFGNYNLIIFFVGVVSFTVLSGMPIAFSFGLAVFAYLALSTRMPLSVVVGRMDEGMAQPMLLAVPMFIFLGLLLEMTGMARAMIAFLASLLGHVRGGLSFVLIGAMYLVSGISGSKAADMAAVAPTLFPEMIKRGSKPGELVALLSATGAQTETVPPSIVLITIGSVTGISISALFTAGILPGLLLGLVLCILVWWRSRNINLHEATRANMHTVVRAFFSAAPALFLPVLIRLSVVEGIATATEASIVGIVYSVAVGLLVYQCFPWRRLGPMLVETAALSGAILLIIGTATAMGWALTQSGFSQSLAGLMGHLPGGRSMFLAISIIAFVVLGSVLEGIPAIVLFGPLLFPIAHMFGIHEVQYAIVVVLSMGLGLFSPPFGVGFYGACAVSKVEPALGMRPIAPYMLVLFVGIVIIACVPWISTGFLQKG